MTDLLTPDDIEAMFTRTDSSFLFARWGRPIAPIVFGVDDATVSVVKGALEAMSVLTQHPLAETDAELGSNLMFFFFRDWDELLEVPDLDRLVPDLDQLLTRLETGAANQYRFFRFDADGAIKAGFVFLRMDSALIALPADVLILGQVAQMMLLWGEGAFATTSPLAVAPGGATILRPEIAELIRAGYNGVLPNAAQDKAHALRLFARMQQA